jgi:toxin YoeB
MAQRKIEWSLDAIQDLKLILEYFNNRNKSKRYSRKLYKKLNSDLEQLQENPSIGKQTNLDGVRCIVSSNYELIYKQICDDILVIMVWDCRRNPKDKVISKRV